MILVDGQTTAQSLANPEELAERSSQLLQFLRRDEVFDQYYYVYATCAMRSWYFGSRKEKAHNLLKWVLKAVKEVYRSSSFALAMRWLEFVYGERLFRR